MNSLAAWGQIVAPNLLPIGLGHRRLHLVHPPGDHAQVVDARHLRALEVDESSGG